MKKARKQRAPRFQRALPQHVHLMPPRARERRSCGETSGGYIRTREKLFLSNFLRLGGGLCPECERIERIPRP